MNYTVEIYKNTGFNSSNIPDSITLVRSSQEPITATALNIVQNRFINSVTIKTEFNQIKDADYCILYTDINEDLFCYFVNSVVMENSDTATIGLSPDVLTSVGIKNLSFLDGITERHHVTDDTFAKYTEEDPLLNCCEPLENVTCFDFIDIVPTAEDGTKDTSSVRLCKTSIDLHYLDELSKSNDLGCKRFSSDWETASGEILSASVDVPVTPPLNSETITTYDIDSIRANFRDYNTATFDIDSEEIPIAQGIQRARDLGTESAILAQYQVPKIYCNYSNYKFGENSENVDPTQSPYYYHISLSNDKIDIIPRKSDTDTSIDFEYDTTVVNKRVLYGKVNSYKITTAAGNSLEFLPEDLYNLETPHRPRLIAYADLRPTGCPYFKFKYFKGDDNNFVNTVAGAQWQNVPLTFNQQSGNILSTYNSDTQRYLQLTNRTVQRAQEELQFINDIGNNISSVLNFTNGAFSTVANPINYNSIDFRNMGNPQLVQNTIYDYETRFNSSGMGIPLLNVMSSLRNAQIREFSNSENFQKNLESNLMNFYYSQTNVIPEINFNFTNNLVRDYVFNGVLVTRIHPSNADLKRQDRLLEMFGYKHTDTIKQEYFFNRQKFNYILAHGISLANKIPQYLKNLIESQLSNGVRVWHTLPDEQYYTPGSNPIKEVTE